jgi:hypothetical protein
MITAAALTFPRLQASVASLSRQWDAPVRHTAVTCNDAIQVTIYSCRISVWEAWQEVLKADLKMPHFRSTWPAARQFYAKPFADFVDELMLNGSASRP